MEERNYKVTKSGTVSVTVRLPKEQLEQLDAWAKGNCRSRTEIIRRALDAYLEEHHYCEEKFL